MQLQKKITNRINNWLDNTLDIYGNRLLIQMRKNGQLLFLSELIPCFRNTKLFVFGTGGSIANLKNVERLKNYNLLMTTTGPYHCFRKYGFVPNFWTLTYAPIIDQILEQEKTQPLDFSDTFILIPTNDSICKININTPSVKELINKHPEATYVLYRCILHSKQWPVIVPPTYLMKDIEPIHGLYSNVLDNLFLPICFYLDVSTVYFSGIDLIPTTGHFWDRSLHYQTMEGKPLEFPESKLIKKCADIVIQICQQKGKKIFRLENSETLLQYYPFINFELSLNEATTIITPDYVKTQILHSYFGDTNNGARN